MAKKEDLERFKKCISDTIPIEKNRQRIISQVIETTKEIQQQKLGKGRTLLSYLHEYIKYHTENKFEVNNFEILYEFIDRKDKVINSLPRVDRNPNVVVPFGHDTAIINITINNKLSIFPPATIIRNGSIYSIGNSNYHLFLSKGILDIIDNMDFKYNLQEEKIFIVCEEMNLYINENEDENSNILYYIIIEPHKIYFNKDLIQTQKIPIIEPSIF